MIRLSEVIQPGDIIFDCSGNSGIGKLIKKLTFGDAKHVAIAYNNVNVFETDGAWGKAKFNTVDRFQDRAIEVYRFKDLSIEQRSDIQALCDKYVDSPYSYLDIASRGLLFWLHPKLRDKIVEGIGTKKFMICSELSMRIIYEALNFEPFKHFEGLNPQEMLILVRQWPDRIEKVSL